MIPNGPSRHHRPFKRVTALSSIKGRFWLSAAGEVPQRRQVKEAHFARCNLTDLVVQLFQIKQYFNPSSFLDLEVVMAQSGKKRYEKPVLKRVKLDAKCAVLGFCKTTGKLGPGTGCMQPIPTCFAKGS